MRKVVKIQSNNTERLERSQLTFLDKEGRVGVATISSCSRNGDARKVHHGNVLGL